MKKQKRKKFLELYKKIIFVLIFIFGFWIWFVFASFSQKAISNQTATWTWSFDSKINIMYQNTNSGSYYINDWNNSTIVWDYLKWYYFDSVYWYFKFDWSTDPLENVRIIGSTNKCSSWYWYKFDWKAKWWYAGFIDFWYDANTFIYYCLNDNKIYGRAYWKYIWYQDFNWISLEIAGVEDLAEKVKSDIFINDTSQIDNIIKPTWQNSNAWQSQLWWNTFKLDDTKESIFYIIK